jgi:hypothetical protein
LYGCSDGGIRVFKNDVKVDELFSPATDVAITSYMALPIRSISAYAGMEAVFKYLRGTTTGGTSSATFGNTDTVTWSVHLADDAESVLEQIKDGNVVTGVTLVAAGLGYHTNDVLTVVGGTGTAATATVATVAAVTGAVTAVSLTTAGSYIVFPTNPVTTTVAPGGGSGCTLTLTPRAYVATGMWVTAGMQKRDRVGRRGRYGTVVLSDATASKSWGVEMITGEFEPVGSE